MNEAPTDRRNFVTSVPHSAVSTGRIVGCESAYSLSCLEQHLLGTASRYEATALLFSGDIHSLGVPSRDTHSLGTVSPFCPTALPHLGPCCPATGRGPDADFTDGLHAFWYRSRSGYSFHPCQTRSSCSNRSCRAGD